MNLTSKKIVFPFFWEKKKFFFCNYQENRISNTGVQHLLKAIQYQETFIKFNISTRNSSSTGGTANPSQGLLRLELQVN